MAGFKDLPPVGTANWAQRVTEMLRQLTGLAGDGQNRALLKYDLAGMSTGGGGGGGTIVIGGGGSSYTPDLTPPPTPTGLLVTAGFTNLLIECDDPIYTQGHGHDRTVVYGATRATLSDPQPTFADAVELCQFQGTVYAYPVNPNSIWHIWIKWKSIDGVESSSPAGGANGVMAQAGQDVAGLLETLQGQITESELYAALGARIDLIDGPEGTPGTVNARIKAETDSRTTADSALSSRVDTVEANVGTNAAAITAEQTARADADTALAGQITTLGATVDDNTAAIQAEQTARADADSALSSQVTTVQARLANAKLGIFSETWADDNALSQWEVVGPAPELAIVTEAATGAGNGRALKVGNNAGNDQAWLIHKELIPFDPNRLYKATVSALRASGTGTVYAGFVGVAADGVTLVNVDGAASTSSQHYHAAAGSAPGAGWGNFTGYTKGFGGSAGTFGAAADPKAPGKMHPNVRYLRAVLIVNYSSQAGETRIGRLLVEDGAASLNTVSIQEETTARASETSGLLAQYTVKVDVNGYVSGFGLASTAKDGAPTSAFIVRADKFAVSSPSGPGITPATPFVVNTTDTVEDGVTIPAGVYMDAAYIRNLSALVARLGNAVIDDAKIADLSAAKITAGSLKVGSWLRSTSYTPGSAGWQIAADGTVEFQNGTFRGTIYASAGQIAGHIIESEVLHSPDWNGTANPNGTGWAAYANGNFYINNLVARGSINGGGFSSYAWPVAGQTGYHLSASGLLIGNYNDGRYVQITAAGNLYAPKFYIENGQAVFSGALSAASGTFAGSLSAATGTFAGNLSAAGGSFAGSLTTPCVYTDNIVGAAVTTAASASGTSNASCSLTVPPGSSSLVCLCDPGVWDNGGGSVSSGAMAIYRDGVLITSTGDRPGFMMVTFENPTAGSWNLQGGGSTSGARLAPVRVAMLLTKR